MGKDSNDQKSLLKRVQSRMRKVGASLKMLKETISTGETAFGADPTKVKRIIKRKKSIDKEFK